MKVYQARDDKAKKFLDRAWTRRQRLRSDQVMARVRGVVMGSAGGATGS